MHDPRSMSKGHNFSKFIPCDTHVCSRKTFLGKMFGKGIALSLLLLPGGTVSTCMLLISTEGHQRDRCEVLDHEWLPWLPPCYRGQAWQHKSTLPNLIKVNEFNEERQKLIHVDQN